MSFCDVLDRLKDVLSCEKGGIIFDKDVAKALEINQFNFATMKARSTIPLQEITTFCVKRKISINWILFGQAIESIRKTSENVENMYYINNSCMAS